MLSIEQVTKIAEDMANGLYAFLSRVENCVTFTLKTECGRNIEATFRRHEGKTPHEKLEECYEAMENMANFIRVAEADYLEVGDYNQQSMMSDCLSKLEKLVEEGKFKNES